MKELISIKNLSIKKENKIILHDFSLNFYEGINTYICGPSGSGKTLLLKAIAKEIKYKGEIKSFKVAIAFDKNFFSTSFIEDELRYIFLDELQKEFLSNFFSKDLMKKNPNELTFYQRKLLSLCSVIHKNPKIVFIDNLYSFLDQKDIEKFNIYFRENNITVVLVSTKIEESLNYEYMIVMNEGMIAIEGQTNQVLMEEKLLKRLGIGLPFYVDLSIQLKYYNLVDNIYLKKEELVSALWK